MNNTTRSATVRVEFKEFSFEEPSKQYSLVTPLLNLFMRRAAALFLEHNC